jgi:hypothetical protein
VAQGPVWPSARAAIRSHGRGHRSAAWRAHRCDGHLELADGESRKRPVGTEVTGEPGRGRQAADGQQSTFGGTRTGAEESSRIRGCASMRQRDLPAPFPRSFTTFIDSNYIGVILEHISHGGSQGFKSPHLHPIESPAQRPWRAPPAGAVSPQGLPGQQTPNKHIPTRPRRAS